MTKLGIKVVTEATQREEKRTMDRIPENPQDEGVGKRKRAEAVKRKECVQQTERLFQKSLETVISLDGQEVHSH